MKKQGFLLGSAILMFSMLVTKILGLFYKIPLTNILGGEGMSYYSSAYSIFMPVFAISVSGLTTALAKTVSENLSFKRYKNALKIKRISMLFFSLTGLIFTLITLVIGYPVCVYLLHSRDAFLSVAAISPSIFFASVMSVQRGFFEGGRNMLPTCISEIIESVLKVMFGIGGAYLALFMAQNEFAKHGTVFHNLVRSADDIIPTALPYISAFSLLGVALSTGVASIYLFIISKKRSYRISKEQLNLDKVTDKRRNIISFLIALAVPIALSSVITTVTSVVDTLTIQPILKGLIDKFGSKLSFVKSPGGVDLKDIPAFMYGSFTGLALTVFSLVPSLTSMLGKSALPNIAHHYARGDREAINRNSQNTIFVTLIISIPAGLGITFFSKEILTTLFYGRTAEIDACWQSLSILGIATVFISLTVTSFSLLQSIGKEKVPIFILLGALVIKLILNIVLIRIPTLGVSGAAISTTVFYIITALVSTVYYFKTVNCKIDIFTNIIKPLYASANCIMAAIISNDWLKNYFSYITSFLASVIISVIIYILSLSILFKINKKNLKCRFLS